MPRTMLTDETWSKLRTMLLDARVYDKPGLRQTVEGMLFRMRMGCPWRDIPSEFGNWNSIFKRFNEWSRNEKIFLVFKLLSQDPDLEWEFIDGTVVKAHQHSSGAAKASQEIDHAIGRSVAGLTSKLHLAVDSMGLPIDFEITGGEVHDAKIGPKLVEKLPRSDFVIADKGYDSEDFREQIRERKSTPIIPRKRNSKTGNADVDWDLYKLRHLVENAIARLKHFRGIATRFDKLKRNDVGTVALACAFIWLTL